MNDPKTASQAIMRALAEQGGIVIDHETPKFIAFRFWLSDSPVSTCVRVPKDSPEAAALLARI